VHAASFSAQVQPHRGGTLVEWTDLRREINVLNVLTRRQEWYQAKLRDADFVTERPGDSHPAPDRHEALAYDVWDRGSFRDRFLDGPPSAQAFAHRALLELGDFAEAPYEADIRPNGVTLSRTGTVRTPAGVRSVKIRKSLRFDIRGRLTATYHITPTDGEPFDAHFAVELNFFLPGLVAGQGTIRIGRHSLGPRVPGSAQGSRCFLEERRGGGRTVKLAWSLPAEIAVSPIRTVAQTEAGFEMTCQGHGLVIAWPLNVPPGGSWAVEIAARINGKE